jgi:hypothetical protein
MSIRNGGRETKAAAAARPSTQYAVRWVPSDAPRGWSRGLVWEDAIAGAGIYEKTPARNLILNVD